MPRRPAPPRRGGCPGPVLALDSTGPASPPVDPVAGGARRPPRPGLLPAVWAGALLRPRPRRPPPPPDHPPLPLRLPAAVPHLLDLPDVGHGPPRRRGQRPADDGVRQLLLLPV